MEVDTEAVLVDQSGLPVQAGQDADQEAYQQGHYIEVVQGVIFMEQNMRFALILGRLAILKKRWTNYEQLLRLDFSCFYGQFFFLKKHRSFRTKSCIIYLLIFFGKKLANYSQLIVYCSTRDTCATSMERLCM